MIGKGLWLFFAQAQNISLKDGRWGIILLSFLANVKRFFGINRFVDKGFYLKYNTQSVKPVVRKWNI